MSLAEAIYAKDVIVPVHPGITAATGLLVTDLQYEYTHSTLLVLDKAGEAEFARVSRALDELISAPTASSTRTAFRRRSGVSARSPNAAMSARVSSCAPTCPTAAHGGIRQDGHREFLQCPQAGLRPRLPRPVLRDHHAARHRHGGGRYAEAAEARQGRRTIPRRRCSTPPHGLRRWQGARDAALPARKAAR